MRLIKEICEHCRYKQNSNASFPCVDCCSRDRWELAETIIVCSKDIEALQHENEQLQVQNGAMREAIRYVLYHLKRGGESWIIDKLEPVISDTPTTYHNPADMVALKQAREALRNLHYAFKREICPFCEEDIGASRNSIEQAEKALVAIDKIGGREDV